ncbi:aldo/keto reductase [Enterococcus gallinarum]|uniref:aldo/keto reductase n=1 Tax=Enterococcus gallinarum TaxID=1353 RepID=UPI0015586861|nr:aldo/keto reductase [Enterococcus gallinarum]NQE03940.1 aldo/keto reductase [Enterococcus gallinarum]
MTTIPTVTLSNGVEMPQLGFGVFQVPDLKECEEAVSNALKVGYRLIDTAAAYQNEKAVGQAIAKSDIKREEIFVTSKLWVSDFTYERAKAGIETSLNKLGMDYIDLYLLHQPYGDVIGAWKALEEAYHEGKIRSIGVSNFYPDQLKNLELSVSVKPVLNQIEVNPWFQQDDDVAFIQQEGMRVEAWAPFAEGKHQIFSNEVLTTIGAKYGKTSGQVILRWLLQRDITVIPKTVRRERMVENMDVFNFELTSKDIRAIAELNKNESQFFDHRDPVAIEQIFGSSLVQLRS